MKKKIKKCLIPTLVALIAIIWQMYGLNYGRLLMYAEQLLCDSVYRRPAGITCDIKIIAIDEETLSAYGRFEEWSREKLTELIALLTENPEYAPAVIGLDIILAGDSAELGEQDIKLAEVCDAAGNVVVANNLVYRTLVAQAEDGSYYYDEENVQTVEQPYETLFHVTRQGFANPLQDKDGYIRRAKLMAEYKEEIYYSFANVISNAYLEHMGGDSLATDVSSVQFLYSGKPGEYERVSLCDVLSGTVDTRRFRDSIVLVGAYASGSQDSYHVAVERGVQMYGVEIHANVIESLLAGKIVESIPNGLTALLVAAVLFLYAMVAERQKLFPILTEGVSVMALWLTAGVILKRYGWLLPLSVLEIGMIVLMVYYVGVRYLTEYWNKKRVLNAFQRYMEPEVIKELGKQGSFELKLGGESRSIAVLFVDIRGFTSMSESLLPEQVVEILNEYLEVTSEAIFKNRGTLDKFIGDAAMAIFNAPVDLEDYVYMAVCAAWDMLKEAETMEQKLLERYGKSVQFGIGIHCGPAIVGNVGSERRMDYTAIGDTVNTAARLESNAARGEILISQEVYEAVKERIVAEPVGELALKGKSRKVSTYRLLSVK